MKKNSTMKMVFSGTLVAVAAALGISAYQIGTSDGSNGTQEIFPMESGTGESAANSDEPSASVGTNQAVADLSKVGDKDFLAGAIPETDIPVKMTPSDTKQTKTSDVEASASTGNVVSAAEVAAAYKAPEIHFSEDTLMEWPLNGNILIDYSMDNTTYFPTLDQYKLSPAIAVGADEGAPVVSAVNGNVMSIQENAETGTTLTMDLGNGYQAIYGQLTDLTVSEGENVTKGTTIGYIAKPTKYYSKEGANLYFAMKKDGQAIDPITYLP